MLWGLIIRGFVVLKGLYGALQDAKRLASEAEKAWLILEFADLRETTCIRTLSICLSIYASIYPSIYLNIYLSAHTYIHTYIIFAHVAVFVM